MRSRPTNPRLHGAAPYRVVVVHGGPGAPGSMAPVARVLARTEGVLEPWQTAHSVAGQVEELSGQIERWAAPPVTLIGHSWGAWLSVLLASERPSLVSRLALVGSGPFRAQDAQRIQARRRRRLTSREWNELERVETRLGDPRIPPSPATLRRLGRLSERADSCELLPHRALGPPPDPVAFRKVWPEAEEMRRRGVLLQALRRLRMPILVLHGRVDPHPVEGVVQPLRQARRKVEVVVLDRCGHYPWWERYARDAFFDRLREWTDRPSSR